MSWKRWFPIAVIKLGHIDFHNIPLSWLHDGYHGTLCSSADFAAYQHIKGLHRIASRLAYVIRCSFALSFARGQYSWLRGCRCICKDRELPFQGLLNFVSLSFKANISSKMPECWLPRLLLEDYTWLSVSVLAQESLIVSVRHSDSKWYCQQLSSSNSVTRRRRGQAQQLQQLTVGNAISFPQGRMCSQTSSVEYWIFIQPFLF